MKQNPQVSATISSELFNWIYELAGKEGRTVSGMVAILLQQAMKEKTRPRRGNKQDNTENIAQNMGKGNKE